MNNHQKAVAAYNAADRAHCYVTTMDNADEQALRLVAEAHRLLAEAFLAAVTPDESELTHTSGGAPSNIRHDNAWVIRAEAAQLLACACDA